MNISSKLEDSGAQHLPLAGKNGLVIGLANDSSIAAGCLRAFHGAGANICATFQSEKAWRFVKPVAEQVEGVTFTALDVEDDDALDRLFNALTDDWGKLDFVLHAVAFCPKDDLHARVTDCSRAGFLKAMDVSVHSFIRLANRAEPLMTDGGALLTLSYFGAEKVVENYNIMGPVKSALESTTRYLAADLGPKGIRVNALSPGPIMTRAASGIGHFDDLVEDTIKRAPQRRLVSIEDVGQFAAFLASDAAKSITGNVSYVDSGFHIIA